MLVCDVPIGSGFVSIMLFGRSSDRQRFGFGSFCLPDLPTMSENSRLAKSKKSLLRENKATNSGSISALFSGATAAYDYSPK